MSMDPDEGQAWEPDYTDPADRVDPPEAMVLVYLSAVQGGRHDITVDIDGLSRFETLAEDKGWGLIDLIQQMGRHIARLEEEKSEWAVNQKSVGS